MKSRMLILVQRAHREILVFASPFFEAALSGNWSETAAAPQDDNVDAESVVHHDTRRQSVASIITIAQMPATSSSNATPGTAEMTIQVTETAENMDEEIDTDVDDLRSELESLDKEGESNKGKEKARDAALGKLTDSSDKKSAALAPRRVKSRTRTSGPIPDAVVVLKEEKACIFHDFLKFVYPQLVELLAYQR